MESCGVPLTVEGRLATGTRLPASRDFAVQHGLSRGTIVSVFERLQAEGYISSRVGSGTSVNRLAARHESRIQHLFRAFRYRTDLRNLSLDQAVLADLITAGHLGRHLGRMRTESKSSRWIVTRWAARTRKGSCWASVLRQEHRPYGPAAARRGTGAPKSQAAADTPR